MSIPMFLVPMRMEELGVSGEVAGLTMGLPFAISVFAVPFMDALILKIGLEQAILYSNIVMVISFAL